MIAVPNPFPDLEPPYATIVADPPWPYASRGEVLSARVYQRPRSWDSPLSGPGAAKRYSLMPMQQLKELPVGSLAADDAHLYLWTTNAFMVEAHELARAWGFEPKTILTWVKTHQEDTERVSMKTGYYFRGATEHIVFAVRGSLRLQTREGLPTAFLWPRLGHSIKPPAFFDLVEQASPGPYLELFSRTPRLGWDSWGHGFESKEMIR